MMNRDKDRNVKHESNDKDNGTEKQKRNVEEEKKSEIGFFVRRFPRRIFYLTCLIVFKSKLIDVVKKWSFEVRVSSVAYVCSCDTAQM